MKYWIAAAVLCAATGLRAAVNACLNAQVLASQLGQVAQTVDSTRILIEYYRPRARGRELFGAVVKWGDVWTPGANWATTLEVDRDVRINGHSLPKGKYSLWIRPQRDSAWNVMLSRTARAFHLWPPLPSEEQLRIAVTPQPVSYTEVLTWSFPAVMRDATLLQMQWGETSLAMHIAVEPSRPPVITEQERAAYAGQWTLELFGRPGQPPASRSVEVLDVDGALRVKGLPADSAADSVFGLVAIGGRQFHPCHRDAGRACAVDATVTILFATAEERPLSFEIRGPDDRAYARAVRVRP